MSVNNMVFEFDMPDECSGEVLDQYLQSGWFRDGSLMSRYELIHFRNNIYSVAPLRANLETFSFSKNQRKLLRKSETFQKIIRPVTFSESKEEMYQVHRERFKSNNSPKTLRSYFLEEGSNTSPFETWELELYHNEQLVGVSFFDMGKDSICSILAIFHPEFEKKSLGITTMLLEVELALAQGKKYYYPGYVLDSPSVFDYKRRLDALEFYNWSNEWLPLAELDGVRTPNQLIRQKLKDVQKIAMDFAGMDVVSVNNEQFFYHIWHQTFDLADVVPTPMYLEIKTQWGHRLTIQYHFNEDYYTLTLHHYYGFFYQDKDPIKVAEQLRQTFWNLNQIAEVQQVRLQELKDSMIPLGHIAESVQFFSNGNKVDGFIELCVEGKYLTFYISYLHTSGQYEIHASNGVRDTHINSFNNREETIATLMHWLNRRSLSTV
ncbi:hypothetical protein V6R21_12065 [Limibacter armeniacum]|uniref:hypothetical protein n=1 Tax=Limibacter armeniacum TaxID=466084 RepID=UPI002FE56AF3